jgi:REP element-mobilizing transposase RayT
MASPPRLAFPGTTVIITTRIQSGLPFVCNPLMEFILYGILARAQHLFPLVVCHFVIMGNHIHLIIVIKNPDDLPAFMNLYKTEVAHAINQLLGRRQISVWHEGYDGQTILTLDDVLEKIVYIYTNPQAANLVDTIEEYPGVSSWEMYSTGKFKRKCPRIRRPAVQKLKRTHLSLAEATALRDDLASRCKKYHFFTLTPDAWLDSFGITDPEERRSLNESLIERIRAREAELREARLAAKKCCIGRERLMLQPINKSFTPKTFGRRMWCISRDKEKRISFIKSVKALITEAREVRNRWKVGDYSVPYPLGLFPPSMPKLGNLLPSALD